MHLEIDDIAFGGAGVGRNEGKAVFVRLTAPKEMVKARIVERRKSFDRAELVAVLRKSEHRVEAPCPYFGTCGGCDYQHMNYEFQLELKRKQIKQIFQRIAHMHDVEVAETVGSPKQFEFRNRITVHACNERVGFFQKQSRSIVDVKRCAIATQAVNEKLRKLRASGCPAGSHITIRENDDFTSFHQTNDLVAALLLQHVVHLIEGGSVVDAYCGSGFFSHALADKCERVVGIEWNELAIKRARARAKLNEEYLCANVDDILARVLEQMRPATIVLDPPSIGLNEYAALLQFPPKHLIYVSCNPTTLARDISRLKQQFRIQNIQPFDMFPQTAEVEVVVSMRSLEG